MNQLNLLPEVLASLALLFGTVCIGGLSIYPPPACPKTIFLGMILAPFLPL